jgi:hypothetical protein
MCQWIWWVQGHRASVCFCLLKGGEQPQGHTYEAEAL